MTAKEYLNNVRTIDIQLKVKEHRLVKLRQDLYTLQSIDYSKDRVDGGQGLDMGDKIAKIQEMEKKINAEWDELIFVRDQAEEKINQLPDMMYRAVLLERYINCKDWENIAVDLHYSWKGIFKLHGRALKSFEIVHSSTLKYI